MTIPSRHPDCGFEPTQCRITPRQSMHSPITVWRQEFDGNGRPVGSDPNTYLTDYTCATCGGEWRVARTGNESKVTVTQAAKGPRR